MLSLNEKISKLKLHGIHPTVPIMHAQIEKLMITEQLRLDFSVVYATLRGRRIILDTPFPRGI